MDNKNSFSASRISRGKYRGSSNKINGPKSKSIVNYVSTPGANPASFVSRSNLYHGKRLSHGRFNKKSKYNRKSTLDFSKLIKKVTPVKEVSTPKIKHKFVDFKFEKILEKNILNKGYSVPTPIQDQSIPFIMKGEDVIGLANTGTGKTGAFLLPLIEKVYKDKNQKVLILAPTRELAVQIEKEFRGFSLSMRVFSTLTVGGMPIYNQIKGLSRNPGFVIGTPGRVQDLNRRGKIKFSEFNNVVLDEVDHMLDMGFVEPIIEILNSLNSNRQSLFFSATMPAKIRDLVKKFMSSPVTVEIISQNNINNIEQNVIKVKSETEKFPELKKILLKPEFNKVLIFSETKRQVDRLSKQLIQEGFRAESIHGDKRQSQRRKALSLFDSNRAKILVATDVASRGLDINNITHVINYTAPKTTEDYTHRIGRTGRGSNKGSALTFVNHR